MANELSEVQRRLGGKDLVRYSRVSAAMAGILCGDHSLTLMDHRGRVELLYGLQTLMEATLKVGWVEHTNDWDWSVQVTMEDGTVHGTTFEEPYVNCDSFALVAELDSRGEIPYDPRDPTLARITHLRLEIHPLDIDRELYCWLLIDDIAQIHIEED